MASSGSEGSSRTQRRVADVGARLLASWREESVRVALWASAAVHLLVGMSPYARGVLPRFALEDLALSISVVHAGTALLPARKVIGAQLLLGAASIEMVALGVIAAWQPEFALLALFLSVYGGLLLPRRWGWLPPALVFAFFATYALLDPLRYVVVAGSPNEASNWRRVAVSYAAITGVLVHVTERTLRLLLEAHDNASKALAEATAERRRLELVRTTIKAAQRHMARAAEGDSARSLAKQLQHRVEGLLSEVREELSGLELARDPASVRVVASRLMSTTEGSAAAIRQLLAGVNDTAPAGDEAQASEEFEVSDIELLALPRPVGNPEEWRRAALGRALGLATIVYGVALLGLFVTRRPLGVREVFFEGLALAASAIGWRFQRLANWQRASLFLGALVVPNASIVLVRGYMAPTSVLALAAACLCATVYASRYAAWVLLVATSAVFLLGARGPLQGSWQDAVVTPDNMANWWRLSLVFPLACWALSRIILDLLDRLVRSLSELNTALGFLSRARRALERSSDELSTMSRQREQASRADEEVRSVRRGAHDLGNSLAVLLGWSEQLQRSAHDTREVAHACAVLRETTDEIEGCLRSFDTPAPPEPANLRVIA